VREFGVQHTADDDYYQTSNYESIVTQVSMVIMYSGIETSHNNHTRNNLSRTP